MLRRQQGEADTLSAMQGMDLPLLGPKPSAPRLQVGIIYRRLLMEAKADTVPSSCSVTRSIVAQVLYPYEQEWGSLSGVGTSLGQVLD